MKLGAVAWVLASRVAWGATGMEAAGRVLVGALGAKDEDVRTIAGILLTKAGSKAEPLLGEALQRGRNVPMVIGVLGSIGDPAAIPTIQPFAQSERPRCGKGRSRCHPPDGQGDILTFR